MSGGRLHTVCRSTPLSAPGIEQTKFEDSTLVRTISDKSCLSYLCDGQCGRFQALYVARIAAARRQDSQARLTAPSVGAKVPRNTCMGRVSMVKHGTRRILLRWSERAISGEGNMVQRECGSFWDYFLYPA